MSHDVLPLLSSNNIKKIILTPRISSSFTKLVPFKETNLMNHSYLVEITKDGSISKHKLDRNDIDSNVEPSNVAVSVDGAYCDFNIYTEKDHVTVSLPIVINLPYLFKLEEEAIIYMSGMTYSDLSMLVIDNILTTKFLESFFAFWDYDQKINDDSKNYTMKFKAFSGIDSSLNHMGLTISASHRGTLSIKAQNQKEKNSLFINSFININMLLSVFIAREYINKSLKQDVSHVCKEINNKKAISVLLAPQE